jgi:hypothetical protein
MGFGQYGFLAREHLDISNGRLRSEDWQIRIDGIEIFPDYLTPVHRYVYNHLYVGNALEIIPTLDSTYDLILLIDIIEHFDVDHALRLIRRAQSRAHNLLISTPRSFLKQGACFGNQYEEHLSLWGKKDLQSFSKVCCIPNDYSLICCLGRDVERIQKRFHGLKNVLKRNLPLLAGAYRALRTAIQTARL